MNSKTSQRILIVGLGVSGVSALRYLAARGADLVVTDSRAAPKDGVAMQAEFPQFEYRFGAFSAPEPLTQFAHAVVGPGVDLRDPFIQRLQAAGVPVMGDIELFARAAQAPVIGITGSNGKSTVTTLVGEMAKAAGWRVGVGGNLGTPALDLLRDDAQLYVLELSSFQLETTHSLRCQTATLLNLSQDHLDRHGTMEHYGAAKAVIFRNCAHPIINRDDVLAQSYSPVGAVSFGLDAPASSHYGFAEGFLCRGSERLLPLEGLHIYGLHNAANALAALALADAAGIPQDASLRALREFRGLPHRCEFVAEVGGARYFNDSKGTNVGSTLAALKGLSAPIVWLGGGQGKGQSFVELREVLGHKGRAAILFGEDAAQIENDIFGALPVYREPDMAGAILRARSLAQPRDSVLLSPACASFDQFKGYADRGQQFMTAVRNLT